MGLVIGFLAVITMKLNDYRVSVGPEIVLFRMSRSLKFESSCGVYRDLSSLLTISVPFYEKICGILC